MKRRNSQQERLPSPWTVAAVTVAALLFVHVLVCLLVALVGTDFLLLFALQAGVVTGVLVLLGMAGYGLLRRRGVPRRWMRLLAAGLLCNGLLLVLGAGIVLLALLS